MPLFFYLALIHILIRIGAGVVRKRKEARPAPVCATCSFAHMQYAVSGKRAISCTFGGGVRPITIDVMYCTDYCDRNLPPRLVAIGFARQLSAAERVVETASAGQTQAPRLAGVSATSRQSLGNRRAA